jgi:hypothetical protein
VDRGSATYQSDLDLLFINFCQPRDVEELEVVENGHARYPRLPRLARARAGPHGLPVVLSLRVTARYRVTFRNSIKIGTRKIQKEIMRIGQFVQGLFLSREPDLQRLPANHKS